MFVYEKKLQYPVKIKNPNPKLASVIISQYGGPDSNSLQCPIFRTAKPSRTKPESLAPEGFLLCRHKSDFLVNILSNFAIVVKRPFYGAARYLGSSSVPPGTAATGRGFPPLARVL